MCARRGLAGSAALAGSAPSAGACGSRCKTTSAHDELVAGSGSTTTPCCELPLCLRRGAFCLGSRPCNSSESKAPCRAFLPFLLFPGAAAARDAWFDPRAGCRGALDPSARTRTCRSRAPGARCGDGSRCLGRRLRPDCSHSSRLAAVAAGACDGTEAAAEGGPLPFGAAVLVGAASSRFPVSTLLHLKMTGVGGGGGTGGGACTPAVATGDACVGRPRDTACCAGPVAGCTCWLVWAASPPDVSLAGRAIGREALPRPSQPRDRGAGAPRPAPCRAAGNGAASLL